jgi:hypothetical protein
MCPNHVEHYLDINFLKSSRLSDRLGLWNKYSIEAGDCDLIVKQFVNKCRSSGSGRRAHTVVGLFDKVQSTCIPDSIKDVYSNPIGVCEEEAGLLFNDEGCSNDEKDDDETESEDESRQLPYLNRPDSVS